MDEKREKYYTKRKLFKKQRRRNKIKYNNTDIKEKNKYRNNASLFIKTEEMISKD